VGEVAALFSDTLGSEGAVTRSNGVANGRLS
jgi:hypothetical protein